METHELRLSRSRPANANDLTVVYSTISTLAARVDDLEEELNNAAAVAIMLLKRIKALEAGADL
jgi:hypothetical protein